MGGPGSTAQKERKGGRNTRSVASVWGSGQPVQPEDMPEEVAAVFQRLLKSIPKGLAFYEDSDAIEELAYLTIWQADLREELSVKKNDEVLLRLAHANSRQLRELWAHFAMTPRSRQIAQAPEPESEQPVTKLGRFKKT